jgi:hypothetical protein
VRRPLECYALLGPPPALHKAARTINSLSALSQQAAPFSYFRSSNTYRTNEFCCWRRSWDTIGGLRERKWRGWEGKTGQPLLKPLELHGYHLTFSSSLFHYRFFQSQRTIHRYHAPISPLHPIDRASFLETSNKFVTGGLSSSLTYSSQASSLTYGGIQKATSSR